MGLIAHAGDGNLHPNMIFDERDAEETRRVKSAGYEMLKVCVDLGGSISGEHGIGTDKREAMRWLFTPSTLRLFRRLKNAFDPENLCNPDKLIPVVEDPGQEPAPAPALALPGSGALRIETVDQLQEALKAARRNKKGVFLRGQGTKGFPVPSEALALELRPLSRVLDWDKENFTLTVQAGAALDELRSLTAEAGQYLHIAGQGTLGGVLSARSSRAPRLRDQVIGLKAVLAGGERVEFGAKVMKNVAGYDAAKLFLGAWGTLGAIYEVTLRLFPFPAEKEEESLSQDFSWVRSPLFQKIKKTFDPDHILNPSVFYESFKA
jgi:FAD/FMN-containing dehydrogenase